MLSGPKWDFFPPIPLSKWNCEAQRTSTHVSFLLNYVEWSASTKILTLAPKVDNYLNILLSNVWSEGNNTTEKNLQELREYWVSITKWTDTISTC